MSSQKQLASVDEILQEIGEFSRYQIYIVLISLLSLFPNSYPNLIMYFAGLSPSWQCVSNSTTCLLNSTQDSTNLYRCNIPRNEWKFNTDKTFSIVTQFDLVCDQSWFVEFSTSIYFLGWLCGAFLAGWLSDKYGRKKIFFLFNGIQITTGFLLSFSPNIYIFLLLRAISGFVKPGGFITIIIIVSELVKSKSRPVVSLITWIMYSLIMCSLGVQAYFIREWKTLCIVCSAPYIFILLFYKQIPESIRWMRLHGKTEEATSMLRKIASTNKREYPENLELERHIEEKHGNYLLLFATTRLAACTTILGYVWFACGTVYFALLLVAGNLGGNVYRDYVLMSLVDVPAAITTIFVLKKIGRKKCVVTAFLLASVFLFIVSVVVLDDSAKTMRIVLGMCGLFFTSMCFGTVYIWSVELFPTSLRGKGLGIVQVTSRIGAIASPWIARSLRNVHPSAPFILMGFIGFTASLLCFFLPETKNKPTYETEDDFALEKEKELDTLLRDQPNQKL